MALSMSDEELRKRIANGTPINIIAELNGCSDMAIYNWMKKNGVTRPDANAKQENTENPENPINTPPEVDEVLDTMKEHFSLVKDEIDRLEKRIEPLKVQLRIWSELIKEVEDGKFT